MRYAFIAVGLLLFTMPAVQGQSSGSSVVGSGPHIGGGFSALEKRLIREYFGERNRQRGESAASHGKKGGTDKKDKKDKKEKPGSKIKPMPPGLAKKDSLPPGLQKRLERNGKLPPGLDKRDLPQDLQRELPRRHDHYKRVVADTDVVLIEAATGLVVDIVRDVVKRK